MPDPIVLAPKPTVDDEVRTSVVKALRETLQQAERGEINTILMVIGHPDDTWTDRASETLNFSSMIGRIEILKAKWIALYMENDR